MLNQIAINILLSFSIYLLIAVSFSLIYYTTKFFHLAHAVIITLGAYLAFLLIDQLSFPLPVVVILATVLATGIGLLCEMIVYRPMRKRKSSVLAYLIASIGLYIVLQNSISLYFGDEIRTIRIGEIGVGHEILDAYITTIQLIVIAASVMLFVAVNLFLHYSSTGKAIRAVSSNPELCNIYGINSNKIILIAFGVGSALAAIAGILSSMDTNMTPTFGFNLLLYGVVTMIIGGVGSTRGLLGGALLVAGAQHLAAFYFDPKWMNAITYVVLILFLIWKPLGFSGKQLRKVEI